MLTACFALGQLSGPLLAALSSHFSGGLKSALVLAAVGLAVAGVLAVTGGHYLQDCHPNARIAG